MSIDSVTIGSSNIDFHAFRGEVLDEKKWATTHISGGGGGGQYAQTAPIRSSTSTHDQVFLRAADGTEQAFELTDAHLAVRPGHQLSVFWGIKRGKTEGQYLAAYNHTTKSPSKIRDGMRHFADPPLQGLCGVVLVFSGVAGIGLLLGGAVFKGLFWSGVCAVGTFWWRARRRKMSEAVDALIARAALG